MSQTLLKCPQCGIVDNTDVLDSRIQKDGTRLRRRQCRECNHRFWTLHSSEYVVANHFIKHRKNWGVEYVKGLLDFPRNHNIYTRGEA